MNWTTPQDIKQHLERLWLKGDLLRHSLTGTPSFPLRLPLKTPSSQQLSQHFSDVRDWAQQWAQHTLLRVDWQPLNHRVQGTQRLPSAVWLDNPQTALNWLGHQKDAHTFQNLLQLTQQQQPLLTPWLAKRPLQALAHAPQWPHLLAVVQWLQHHPRPHIYLRQVDIPGIHSKFIEQHRSLLCELLSLALPADSIQPEHTGIAQFNARYGFKSKPTRIRFRFNTPALTALTQAPTPDITLDAHSFSQLNLIPSRVFITENETNFLAFPVSHNTLVLFGAGYGWATLSHCHWLHHCPLYYWGDIDTHGFGILNQLRSHFPHTASFLMDSATFHAHRPFWGTEPTPLTTPLPHLTPAEAQLYHQLQHHHYGPHLRLEQEHIGFDGWQAAVLALP